MGDERKRSKIHQKLKEFLTEVTAHSTHPIGYAEAKEMMVRLGEYRTQFEKLQTTLEATATDASALQVQEDEGDKVETTFSKVRGRLRVILETLAPPATATTTSSSSSVKIKLPTISLPSFNGNYTDWTSFKDLFVAAVGDNKDLTGAQKLQYLKGTLIGEPLGLVEYLTTTDQNYTEAWKVLEERYDNVREIIRSHGFKLLDFKPLTTENAKELQNLVDNTVKCLRSLRVLGCSTDEWDDLMVLIVEKKLDPNTRREWAKTLTGTTRVKLEELTRFLNGHIRGLQVANGGNHDQPADRKAEKERKEVQTHHVTADVVNCQFCGEEHTLSLCTSFLEKDPAERSNLVKRARLCFNCLKPDHQIKTCPSPRRCKKCGRKHHTLLHEEEEKATTEESNTKSVQSNLASEEDADGVLLTAIASIPDKNGRYRPYRVLIDPASQVSFITTSCAEKLGLEQYASNVSVKGVGEAKAGKTKGVVNCTIYSRLNENSLSVRRLHVMDKVTGKLPTVECKKDWKHLEGLALADPRWHEPAQVDILLGVKYFHRVLLWRRNVGPTHDAPVAWETIFGWGIAGACPAEEAGAVVSHHISVDHGGALEEKSKEVNKLQQQDNDEVVASCSPDEAMCCGQQSGQVDESAQGVEVQVLHHDASVDDVLATTPPPRAKYKLLDKLQAAVAAMGSDKLVQGETMIGYQVPAVSRDVWKKNLGQLKGFQIPVQHGAAPTFMVKDFVSHVPKGLMKLLSFYVHSSQDKASKLVPLVNRKESES